MRPAGSNAPSTTPIASPTAGPKPPRRWPRWPPRRTPPSARGPRPSARATLRPWRRRRRRRRDRRSPPHSPRRAWRIGHPRRYSACSTHGRSSSPVRRPRPRADATTPWRAPKPRVWRRRWRVLPTRSASSDRTWKRRRPAAAGPGGRGGSRSRLDRGARTRARPRGGGAPPRGAGRGGGGPRRRTRDPRRGVGGGHGRGGPPAAGPARGGRGGRRRLGRDRRPRSTPARRLGAHGPARRRDRDVRPGGRGSRPRPRTFRRHAGARRRRRTRPPLAEARGLADRRRTAEERAAAITNRLAALGRDVEAVAAEEARLRALAGLGDGEPLAAAVDEARAAADVAARLAAARAQLAADGASEGELRAAAADTDADRLAAEIADGHDELARCDAAMNEAVAERTRAERVLDDLARQDGAVAGRSGDGERAHGRSRDRGALADAAGRRAARRRRHRGIPPQSPEPRSGRSDAPVRDRQRRAVPRARHRLRRERRHPPPRSPRRRSAAVAERPFGRHPGSALLALRLATLADHAGRAEPLPFIGDDLFVTFDETRTRAALQALGDVGRRFQCISSPTTNTWLPPRRTRSGTRPRS